MYTLLELESKTFGELKKIGYELNVLPPGDRRCRQSWIDALVGVNPPLLQLLEVSPGVEVDRAQEAIIETVEASPAAEAEQVQELPLESKFGRIVYPRLAQKAIVQVAETSPGVEVEQAREPVIETVEISPGVEVESVEDLLSDCVMRFGDGYVEDEFGRVQFCQCEPRVSQSMIALVAQNLPGSRSKTSTAHQLLELFKSSAHILEDSPRVKTEETVRESAIDQAAKNQESDLNPILTGLSLSDRFLARYSPPRAEVFQFQADADGQLSLIDFEVQSPPEPPDPDDFESLDDFREAIALWDAKHNESSSVHCESSSVHCESSSVHWESSSVHLEPPDPQDFDSMFAYWAAYDAWDKATDDDGEPSSIDKPLEISLDSFVEWVPRPPDWYEPIAFLLEPSKVMEHLRADDSSNTSDFFIPTFGAWGDRPRSDEPPDTGGIFARLPKPKPPNFPPQASWTPVSPSQPKSAQVRLIQASRNYPETIPKLFHCSVAGSSTQPARSLREVMRCPKRLLA
jgi:hypothetical protein